MIFNEYLTHSKKSSSESFTQLCSEEGNRIAIKKLFLQSQHEQPLSANVLTHGIISSLFNNQTEYLSIISEEMKKKQMNLDINVFVLWLMFAETKDEKQKYNGKNIVLPFLPQFFRSGSIDINKSNSSLNTIFNYLNLNNQEDFAKEMDDKFLIVNKSFDYKSQTITLLTGPQSSWANVEANGEIIFEGCFGGEVSDEILLASHYNKNPIIFLFDNFSSNKISPILLNQIFNNKESISHDIVQNVLIKSIYLKDKPVLDYILSNEKFVKVIKESQIIQNFLNFSEYSEQNTHALEQLNYNNQKLRPKI